MKQPDNETGLAMQEQSTRLDSTAKKPWETPALVLDSVARTNKTFTSPLESLYTGPS
jgi:hypothetical protein